MLGFYFNSITISDNGHFLIETEVMARRLMMKLGQHCGDCRSIYALSNHRKQCILASSPRPRYIHSLVGDVDRYNGITVDIGQLSVNITDSEFTKVLISEF